MQRETKIFHGGGVGRRFSRGGVLLLIPMETYSICDSPGGLGIRM